MEVFGILQMWAFIAKTLNVRPRQIIRQTLDYIYEGEKQIGLEIGTELQGESEAIVVRLYGPETFDREVFEAAVLKQLFSA